jgi:hypothetical protein
MNKYKKVEEFLKDLEPDKKSQLLEIRNYILETEPNLKEHIKWNAPSYVLDGEDRITFNLMNKQNLVKLVLHMGSTRKEDKTAQPIMNDTSGLIEWASDIRGYITFNDISEVLDNEKAIKKIVSDWLAIK